MHAHARLSPALFVAWLAMIVLLTACARQPILQDSDQTPVEEYWELVEIAEPVYPPAAVSAQARGHVEVLVLIGSDGRVEEAYVTDSSPRELFVPAVMEALFAFRYEPTERNPERQRMYTEYRFEFEPDD